MFENSDSLFLKNIVKQCLLSLQNKYLINFMFVTVAISRIFLLLFPFVSMVYHLLIDMNDTSINID